MKLQTSGNENQFTSHHLIPSVAAGTETTVLLAAFQSALDSLLEMSKDEVTTPVLEGLYRNFVALKEVRGILRDDLERADVTLEAIEAKLSL